MIKNNDSIIKVAEDDCVKVFEQSSLYRFFFEFNPSYSQEDIINHIRSGKGVINSYLEKPVMINGDIIYIDSNNVYSCSFLKDNWVDVGDKKIILNRCNLDFIPLIKTTGKYSLTGNNIKSVGKYKQSGPLILSVNDIEEIPDGFNPDRHRLDLIGNRNLNKISDNLINMIVEYSRSRNGSSPSIRWSNELHVLVDVGKRKLLEYNSGYRELYQMEEDFS